MLGPAAPLLAHDDPAPPAARTSKLSGCALDQALHAVAVASDGELPPPPAWIVVGEAADFAEQQRQLRSWQERAVEAEAEAFGLKRKLRRLQR